MLIKWVLTISSPKHLNNKKTGYRMHKRVNVYINVTQARSHIHCCSGRAISITYYECVFVALGIQHAMRMHHILICDMSGYAIFFHIIS
jgi:hypothetical protein